MPLRHQKGLSVRAGSQRAKESPLLCPPTPEKRDQEVVQSFLVFSFIQPATFCRGSVTQRREGRQGLNVTGQVCTQTTDRKIKGETRQVRTGDLRIMQLQTGLVLISKLPSH